MTVSGQSFNYGKILADGRLYKGSSTLIYDIPDKTCTNSTSCIIQQNYTVPTAGGQKYTLTGAAWRSGVNASLLEDDDFEIVY